MTSEHSAAPDRRAPNHGVNVRAVFFFFIGFVVVGSVIVLLLWWMQAALIHRYGDETGDPWPEARLAQPLQPSPGHPTLPWQDMKAMRRSQEQTLHSFGVLSNGRAHMPIDRAIDLLIRSGELNKPWKNPATQPFQTAPPLRDKPSVENRT